MLTSEDLNFQLARLHQLGLHSYLVKPIKRLELLGAISGLLSGVFPAQTHSLPGVRNPALAAERPLRILLAEDSPDNRLLIRAYFKNLPYALETAENGSIAIDKFKASPHDLVLMDMQMPVMDGLAATRALRQWEREQELARTPIIALTASALERDVEAELGGRMRRASEQTDQKAGPARRHQRGGRCGLGRPSDRDGGFNRTFADA